MRIKDLDLHKEVAGMPASFHTDIICHIPQVIPANVVLVVLVDLVDQNQDAEYVIEILTNPVHDYITPITRSLFVKEFEIVGLTRFWMLV